jgi:hypothetical protein
MGDRTEPESSYVGATPVRPSEMRSLAAPDLSVKDMSLERPFPRINRTGIRIQVCWVETVDEEGTWAHRVAPRAERFSTSARPRLKSD